MDEPIVIYAGKRYQYTGDDSRLLVKYGQRSIAVIYYKNRFFAMDNACYHHGGPLLMGDIEDVGGHMCLVCPWHRYPISLETGEGLYVGLEFGSVNAAAGAVVQDIRAPKSSRFSSRPALQPVPQIKSKGYVQRVHRVEVRGDNVVVILNTSPDEIASDYYLGKEIENAQEPMKLPVGKRKSQNKQYPFAFRHNIQLEKTPPLDLPEAFKPQPGLSNPSSSELQSCGKGTPRLEQQWMNRGPELFDSLTTSSCARAGVNPLLLKPRYQEGNSFFEDLTIIVHKLVDICEDTRELWFRIRATRMERHFELGEVIEVELGNNAEQTMSLVVTGTNSHGYSALVRRRSGESQRSEGKVSHQNASDWMYYFSVYVIMPVLSVTGSFTLVDHMKEIRECDGRVLWLTCEMGISRALASLQFAFGDSVALPHTREKFCEDPLMVVQLHAERSRERIPKLDILLDWNLRYPFQLTDDLRALTPVPTGEEHPISANAAMNAAAYQDERRKLPRKLIYCFHGFLAEEGSASTERTGKGKQATSSMADVAESPPLTRRRRKEPGGCPLPTFSCGGFPTRNDVVKTTEYYFGSKPFFAFVSGPEKFLLDQLSILRSIGVAENFILCAKETS